MADGGRWGADETRGLATVDEVLTDDEVLERAERSVLAAAMLFADVAALLPTMVRPEDFADPRLALVCAAIADVVAGGGSPDVILVADALRARNRLSTVGGAQFLAELTDGGAGQGYVEAHARIVRESASVRRAVAEAQRLLSLARGGARLEEIEAAGRKVAEAATRTDAGADLPTLADAVSDALEQLTLLASGVARCAGISTGIGALDRVIGGLRPGLLYVIAARPAMGKTALVQDVLTAAAIDEMRAAKAEGRTVRPAIFVSLEMPRVELGQRALAKAAGVDLARLISGVLTQDELNSVFRHARDLVELPIRFIQGPAKLSRIRAAAHRERARAGGVLLIAVDYLQLMQGDVRAENREQEIAAMSKGLKQLAGEIGCPIVELSQLNRGLEARKDKRPMLSDLRESGAIEQDADVVAFIYRDEVYNKDTQDRGVAELIIAKQRNGPTDTVRVRFDRTSTTFRDFDAPRAASPAAGALGGADDFEPFPGDGLPMQPDNGALFDRGDA